MLNWRDPKNPLTGGAERVTLAHLTALVERGHEVYWYSNDFPGGAREETLNGIHIVRGGGKGSSIFKAIAWYRRQEKFDLVTPNYYEAELKFQDVINDKQRVTQLSTPPKITHSVNSVRIQFPGEFLNKQVKGELYLYRASDATKDFRKKFATDQNFIDITLDQNFSGSYEVKLSWEAEGKTFYNEQRIFF